MIAEENPGGELLRIVHCLLAFQGLAIDHDTDPQVIALWSFMIQDILRIDGLGSAEDVSGRYVKAFQHLGVDAEVIRLMEFKYRTMLNMVGEHIKLGAITVKGSNGETSFETCADEAAFASGFCSSVKNEFSN